MVLSFYLSLFSLTRVRDELIVHSSSVYLISLCSVAAPAVNNGLGPKRAHAGAGRDWVFRGVGYGSSGDAERSLLMSLPTDDSSFSKSIPNVLH